MDGSSFTGFVNFVPNILSGIVAYFGYAEFNGDVHFFRFRLEISFLGKFDPKTQNCQFKLKFDT